MTQETTEVLRTTKEKIKQGLDKALHDYQVAALTKRGERVLYDYISNANEIEFTYQPTVVSPKKFFFPQEEVILEYTSDGKVTPQIASKPQVLFGIRPCDLNGIKIMDEAFAESNGDPNYLAKRENTIVIGQDCSKVCDEDAFCYRVKAQDADSGYDVMLHEVADGYLMTIGTPKGRDFVNKYISNDKSSIADLKAFKDSKAQGFAGKDPFKDLDNLPDTFAANNDHPVWQKEADRCLSCGSCIMVCPTCYCFDVADELQLNLKKGERVRRWDACMLHDFTAVAGGEVFRHTAKARLHHRISRKFNYLMRKHGRPVCIGCGRCVRACLADISPKTIAETLTKDKGE